MRFDASRNLLMVLNKCLFKHDEILYNMCVRVVYRTKATKTKNLKLNENMSERADRFLSSSILLLNIVWAFINMLLFGGCWWKGNENVFVCVFVCCYREFLKLK